ELWPVVESRTVIIPPIHKPQVGRLPMKKKKSVDELASQIKLMVLVNRVQHQDKMLVQGMPQVKQVVLVNKKGPRQGDVARNASSQVVGSSQPGVAPSQANQGPSQCSV
nr:transposase, mutator type [Tanacetum cinerariifolium]